MSEKYDFLNELKFDYENYCDIYDEIEQNLKKLKNDIGALKSGEKTGNYMGGEIHTTTNIDAEEKKSNR